MIKQYIRDDNLVHGLNSNKRYKQVRTGVYNNHSLELAGNEKKLRKTTVIR